jgi:hypothetical protein
MDKGTLQMRAPLTALICGGANTVLRDIEAAKQLFVPDAIFAVNNVVAVIKHVDFLVTVHPTKVPHWMTKRLANGYGGDSIIYWTVPGRPTPIGYEFKTSPNTKGGSGLLAISVARYLGFTKIVLAGMPMTPESAHFFDPKPWNECIIYRNVWEKRSDLKDYVRSVSGWTREHFGPPTVEWLKLLDPVG